MTSRRRHKIARDIAKALNAELDRLDMIQRISDLGHAVADELTAELHASGDLPAKYVVQFDLTPTQLEAVKAVEATAPIWHPEDYT